MVLLSRRSFCFFAPCWLGLDPHFSVAVPLKFRPSFSCPFLGVGGLSITTRTPCDDQGCYRLTYQGSGWTCDLLDSGELMLWGYISLNTKMLAPCSLQCALGQADSRCRVGNKMDSMSTIVCTSPSIFATFLVRAIGKEAKNPCKTREG